MRAKTVQNSTKSAALKRLVRRKKMFKELQHAVDKFFVWSHESLHNAEAVVQNKNERV